MEITDVKVELARDCAPILAFASLEFDRSFVVQGLKVLQKDGRHFVAMPSRRVTAACRVCDLRNPVTACFCNWCGVRLRGDDEKYQGRKELYVDIAYSTTNTFRKEVDEMVLVAYRRVVEKEFREGKVTA